MRNPLSTVLILTFSTYNWKMLTLPQNFDEIPPPPHPLVRGGVHHLPCIMSGQFSTLCIRVTYFIETMPIKINPAKHLLVQSTNRNTRKRCEICSKI